MYVLKSSWDNMAYKYSIYTDIVTEKKGRFDLQYAIGFDISMILISPHGHAYSTIFDTSCSRSYYSVN